MKKTVKEKDFWECKRCNITSKTKGRIIPCPRGGCEANVIGVVRATVEIEIFELVKQ